MTEKKLASGNYFSNGRYSLCTDQCRYCP